MPSKPEPDGCIRIQLVHPDPSGAMERKVDFKDLYSWNPTDHGVRIKYSKGALIEVIPWSNIRSLTCRTNSDLYMRKLRAFKLACSHEWKPSVVANTNVRICKICDTTDNELLDLEQQKADEVRGLCGNE